MEVKNPKSVRWNDKVNGVVSRKDAAGRSWQLVTKNKKKCMEAYRDEK